MAHTFDKKRREIQKSLHRRARLRKAYFKLTGKDKPAPQPSQLSDHELDLSAADSEDEIERKSHPKKGPKPTPEEPQLTKKQLASRRRAIAYHEAKERESAKLSAATHRQKQRAAATSRTSRGQPRLGAQVNVLLDKIQKNHGHK